MLKVIFLFLTLCLVAVGCKRAIAPVLTPEQERATFRLEGDLDIQLVASEPLVQDPVFISFDEAGRLWVVEMRGYMPDIDQTGENDAVGRISILIDVNLDGFMDSSIVFLDSLVLPRSIAITGNGALVAERRPLWYAEDLDGDLRADRKTLIDSVYGGSGMPEHSPNGLWRGLDNWYYNAKSKYRYKLTDGGWIRDSTEFRGQWGMSHDDLGRLYYNYNWSPLHADLVPPNTLGRNPNHRPTSGIDHGLTLDRRIYPIRPNPATNRGYIEGTLDEKGRLLEYTAACSPFVYRGQALPGFYGDVFIAEPAGNLVKRMQTDYSDPVLSASAAYSDRDFLTSTDERFRPVFFTSGPDGALYIADMYKGIIEHGPYMTPYLKEQTRKRGLDKPLNKGRIWRVVPKGEKVVPKGTYARADKNMLVNSLDHSDGWHRDMAQRILVESRDTALQGDLMEFLRSEKTPLGKIHALYTLEGLGLLEPDGILICLAHEDFRLKGIALRLSRSLVDDFPELLADITGFVRREIHQNKSLDLEIALTSYLLPPNIKMEILWSLFNKYSEIPLFRDAIMSGLGNDELVMLEKFCFNDTVGRSPGMEIFMEMLGTAVMRHGTSGELEKCLALLVSGDSLNWKQEVLLRGLTAGRVLKDGVINLSSGPDILNRYSVYPVMVQRRLDKLKQVLSWPGHQPDTAAFNSPVKLSEQEQELFVLGQQHYATSCAGCHGREGEGLSRFAPPLSGSQWVLGSDSRLALLVLHGIEGPIEVNGKTYGSPDILPVMPSFSTLDDQIIAGILTYIRCEWGHPGPAVNPRLVSRLRHTTQGRVKPWSVQDLLEHVKKLEAEAQRNQDS